MEQQILAAMLADRTIHETFARIGSESDFSPIGRAVAKAIREYYELDRDVRSCSKELIRERMLSRITNPKHEKPLGEYLDSIHEGVSAPNVECHIRELHKRKVGGQLSLALANGSPEQEVQKLIGEYSRGVETATAVSESSLVDVLDTADLTEEKQHVEYIKLWPKQLNDRLDGGCLRGHHVLVFARPETGKTLFAINLVCGFLHQKLSVLYVGNEEPAADIRDRIRGRLLKTSRSDIRNSRSVAAARINGAKDLGKVHILETARFSDVRRTLEAHGDGVLAVGVVVLDQIRNMRLKSDSRTAELEAAGIEARSIAKEFNVLVVSITQAGDSATNKVYLDMSDVDSSKTGIPASADLMVGIGKDGALEQSNMLGISLCKNKLSGLHDKFLVNVNYQTGVLE